MTLVIGDYTMPQPEVVKKPEYTAIHQALADRLADVPPEGRLAAAKQVLDGVLEWAETIQHKLKMVHQSS